jgi:signal transduction histidine kinase
MFRRILILFLFLGYVSHAVGNEKADALRKTIPQSPDTARAAILVNISKLFQYENIDSCIHYAELASDMAYRTRQYLPLVEAQKLLSRIALEKGNYTKATNYQREVLKITVRERYWDLAMESYNDMAQAWLLRNNYAEAVEFLKGGGRIAKDRNNLEMSKYFYQSLIDSYRKLRSADSVSVYYQKLMNVNLMIDAEAYNNRINVLQTERENLITEVEYVKRMWLQRSTISKVFHTFILIWAILASGALVMAYFWFQYRFKPGLDELHKKLNDKENELDSLRKEQEKTFRFLTHQVYTNINLLSQSIELFKAQHGDLPVANDSPLKRIVNEIYALYGFFQNFMLLLQAQSRQLNPEPVTVNIPQLANNLLADYEEFAVAKDIRLINEVQNNTFAVADERLIDIVLRNMMSNAFKYAPVGTGRITVGTKVGTKIENDDVITEDTGFIEVWVTDDGIGLAPEQAELLFNLADNLNLPGDDDIKGFGLGLPVCKAVIEALGGRVWAETKPGEGFCIRFSLPRAKEGEVNTLSLVENTQEIIITEEDNPLLLLE